MAKRAFDIILLITIVATSGIQCDRQPPLNEAVSPNEIILAVDSSGTLVCEGRRLHIDAPDLEDTLGEQLRSMLGAMPASRRPKAVASIRLANPEGITYGQCVPILLACVSAGVENVQLELVAVLLRPNYHWAESVEALPMRIASPDELTSLYNDAFAFKGRTVAVAPSNGSHMDEVSQVLLVLDEIGAFIHLAPALESTGAAVIELRSLVEADQIRPRPR